MSLSYQIWIRTDEEPDEFIRFLEDLFSVKIEKRPNDLPICLGYFVELKLHVMVEIVGPRPSSIGRYSDCKYELIVRATGKSETGLIQPGEDQEALDTVYAILKKAKKYPLAFALNGGEAKRVFDPNKDSDSPTSS